MRIPIICGATGSGKSDLAYSLSNDIKFELISADAFQVYKGFDIGTAKPPHNIQKRIQHHLIDIVSADGNYNAGNFVNDAEKSIDIILEKGNVPLIVGGTGLYVKSLVEGIFDIPPTDKDYRAELSEIAKSKGSSYLYEMLKKVDSAYAFKIHENDIVRTIRALEVFKATGVSIIEAQRIFRKQPKFSYKVMVLQKNRHELYENINLRTIKMIDSGWVDEVKELLNNGISEDMPSFRAIGYKELASVVKNKSELAKTVDLISQKTRNYAKRQLTWYRGMSNSVHLSESQIRYEMAEYGVKKIC